MIMEEDLIEQIKKALGVSGNYTDVQLLESLRKARNNSHPDGFHDTEIKREKEEKFKTLSGLYESFQKYIEKRKAEMLPAKYEEEELSFDLIQKISEISSLQDENRELIRTNKEIQSELTLCRSELEKIKNNKHIQNVNDISISLKNIYKVKKELSFTVVSLLILVFTQLKMIKSELVALFGIGNDLITIILWICFIFSLLIVIYKSILKYRINYNLKKLTNPKYLNNINLRKKEGYYYRDIELYFTESDLYDYIRSQINKLDSFFFKWEMEIIYRELINYIISYLDQKQIIKKAIPQDLDIYFELNKRSREFE